MKNVDYYSHLNTLKFRSPVNLMSLISAYTVLSITDLFLWLISNWPGSGLDTGPLRGLRFSVAAAGGLLLLL